MTPKNIKTIFIILKEIILLVKYVVDEWEKSQTELEDGDKGKI